MASANLSYYVEQAKLDELQEEWQSRGYKVARHQKLAGREVDLVATRGDQTIVFEVATAESLKRRRRVIGELARSVEKLPNSSFRLVVANPPRKKTIEIDGLADALLGYLSENTISDLDRLSSHTYVESVDDVEVDRAEISSGVIHAAGTAVVSIRLEYGSASDQENDDGLVTSDSFPFEFDVILRANLDLTHIDVESIEVDTSAFYE